MLRRPVKEKDDDDDEKKDFRVYTRGLLQIRETVALSKKDFRVYAKLRSWPTPPLPFLNLASQSWAAEVRKHSSNNDEDVDGMRLMVVDDEDNLYNGDDG